MRTPAASPPAATAPDQQPPPDGPRPRLHQRGPRPAWVGAALAVCALAGFAAWLLAGSGPAALGRADVDSAVKRAVDQARQQDRNMPPDAATAYRIIMPSLVTVTAGAELGTGVVINADGSVLTALHVVSGRVPIRVQYTDGTTSVARVASSQAASDIAVLAVETLPQVVVPAVMGGAAGVGDPVFPVGNPLGLRGSLTAGVVSALGRSISIDGGRTLTGLIQFDAAVNPGNSGGPLLDRNGRVIGIVTGLANPARQPYFVGIGFAVPIATASGVAGGPRQ